jgi:hypothetical protein
VFLKLVYGQQKVEAMMSKTVNLVKIFSQSVIRRTQAISKHFIAKYHETMTI